MLRLLGNFVDSFLWVALLSLRILCWVVGIIFFSLKPWVYCFIVFEHSMFISILFSWYSLPFLLHWDISALNLRCTMFELTCKMITTIVLANTSIVSHNYHLCFVVRTLKIYSPSNFEVYNTYNHHAKVKYTFNTSLG